MTKHELELAYLRAMSEWMTEEHNTRVMVRRQDAVGFSGQLKKEEADRSKYREAQLAFSLGDTSRKGNLRTLRTAEAGSWSLERAEPPLERYASGTPQNDRPAWRSPIKPTVERVGL